MPDLPESGGNKTGTSSVFLESALGETLYHINIFLIKCIAE